MSFDYYTTFLQSNAKGWGLYGFTQ